MSRVFLVDDHAVLRDDLRLVLEAAGHRVADVADAPAAAVAGIAESRPDVVLLDLNLGDRSGCEALAELPRRRIDVPVIVLSMLSQQAQIAEALRQMRAWSPRTEGRRSSLKACWSPARPRPWRRRRRAANASAALGFVPAGEAGPCD